MTLAGCTIGFAITGSFCTIAEILPQIKLLAEAGAEIIPIVSYTVGQLDTRFTKSMELKQTLTEITGHSVIETIPDAEPIGPKKLLDILIVAPCTGNTLAKITHAVTDTPVTMAVKAHLRNHRPVVLAISTNDGLTANAANIGSLLNRKGFYFVPFGQDDPIGKAASLAAQNDLILETVIEAMESHQIQPLLRQRP